MGWMRHRGTLAAMLIVTSWAAGCGESLPPPNDPEAASGFLTAALDAWKAGETPDSLMSRTPPIRMIDRDWQEGRTLVDYELTGTGQQLGSNIQCPVQLTLGEAGGKTVSKRLNYVVNAGQPPVITRLEADF